MPPFRASHAFSLKTESDHAEAKTWRNLVITASPSFKHINLKLNSPLTRETWRHHDAKLGKRCICCATISEDWWIYLDEEVPLQHRDSPY